ncbi:BLUF domain-containing protein [Gelidibacter pelagius]|uniref:BLUF domain-containing protein n=1 Tax=Gelidibacter pelagius TaxID=2819985 RepID=A0ABS3SYH7_9FLAO|nr:BLUF domain-containing protein [Gelidibacter pelagius]MBO3099953.1 BLUF domain-containing protein [Gelidibacter pelagius]
MYQLNYRSTSRPGLGFEDLEAILEEAIATNSARNISGCLIYHNDSFVQILEGNKEDVLQVYEKIKADDRHHTVTLLWKNHVDHRFFEEWHMAYYRPDDKNVKEFVNDLLLLSELTDKPSSSLLTFWASVQKILRDGQVRQFEKVY